MIELTQSQCGQALVIAVTGRIDASVSPQLEETLRQALAEGHIRLVVNLAGASYISSSGLRTLLVAVRQAREQGGDLKLCAPAPRVRQVFALAGFDMVFELWESCEQAAASFSAPQGECPQPWVDD